jgi:predicted nucleotidyltransferase
VDASSIGSTIRDIVGRSHNDVVAVYLFGSTARGTRRRDSDIDIGVLVEGQPPRTLDGLKLDLQAQLGRALGHGVQLVVLNSAPPDLLHRVFRDGKLLLDRDPSLRIRFETRARREYFDVLPYLRLYRRLNPSPA